MSIDFLNPLLVQKHFNAAIETFVVAKEASAILLSRLDLFKIEPHIILDLGAGQGNQTTQLKMRYPNSKIIAIDFAEKLLQHVTSDRLCADALALPLKDQCIDMITANLLLPWCDLKKLCIEMHRVLKPGGLLLFSSFGPDTLRELRESFSAVDQGAHIHSFMDMHDVGDELMKAQFQQPVLEAEVITVMYHNIRSLFQDLKKSGMTNALEKRSRACMTPRQLNRVIVHYNMVVGAFPATFEVIIGHAWGASQRKTAAGEVRIPLSQLLKK